MKKINIHIFVVSLDGINSHITGVGTVVKDFISSLSEINDKLLQYNICISKLTAITSFLSKDSVDFSKETLTNASNTCEVFSGGIYEIKSFASGNFKSEIWSGTKESGTISQWEILSKNAATLINENIKEDFSFIFLHDTVFSQVPKFLSYPIHAKLIWIPHSLGLVFNDRWTEIKTVFERDGILSLIQNNGTIGSTSVVFYEKLLSNFSEENIDIFKISNYFPGSAIKKIKNNFYNINDLDKWFGNKIGIFCWGRCTPQKGWHIFLPALKKFMESEIGLSIHVRLIMAMETAPPKYRQEILDLISNLPAERVLCRYNFDLILPLQTIYNGLPSIIAIPSLFEGMSLVALEAMELSEGNTKIIYNNIQSLSEILIDNHNAYSVDGKNSHDWLNALNSAFNEPLKEFKIKNIPTAIDTYVNLIVKYV